MPVMFPLPTQADLVDQHRKITVPWRDWFTNTIDSLWPVGTIFTTVDPRNPRELLGFGTWVRFAQGRVLVGVNEDDPDFATVMQTGGEKKHTLTVPETPCACP